MPAFHITSARAVAILGTLLGLTSTRLLLAEPLAQEKLELPVRVVDQDKNPVAGAKVIPWALRCAGGHGLWCEEGFGDSKAPEFRTDADGNVVVLYPRYAKAAEWMKTMEVTLSIDHPDFAMNSREFIAVPLKEKGLHEVTLERGARVEIVPLENGRPAPLDDLRLLWSDDRTWHPDVAPVAIDGALRIPRMPLGKAQVLVARLDGVRATHFSSIVDFALSAELPAGEPVRQTVELKPAIRIEGVIGENVPRPVKNGRVKGQSLQDEQNDYGVDWFTWAPIAEDGTFVIESWPAGEAIQLTALCDGYIAESGKAPAVVSKPRDPDPYYRPQVFLPDAYGQVVTIPMAPMVRCEIETVDESGVALSGVKIQCNPGVGWWNGGSQVYCSPLVRGERLLFARDYFAAVDDAFAFPFETVTDVQGRGELTLPAGEQDFRAAHDEFEMPIVRGRRHREIELVVGQTANIRLAMQPKGNEFLGEWDKLSGVLFGCTGDECRRLLDDPGFRERITLVGEKLDAAENPTDSAVLSDAFKKMAAAFEYVDDQEEADKWRRKAAEQAAKLQSSSDGGPTGAKP